MKKILSIAIALAMILALCAGCTKPEPIAEPAPAPEQTDAAAVDTIPVEEVTEAEPEAEPAPKTDVNLIALKGPTGMGMVHLMAENEAGNTQNNYNVQLTGAPDDIVGKIVTGQVDIAAVPINLASNLYKKTNGEVQLLALNTLGVLYILENGTEINTVADLAGKKLMATGQASTPEYVLNYILAKNGIADQVTVEYKTEHSELATLMAAGDETLGMMPEPHVTSVMLKNADVRIALNLTEEWNKVSGGTQLVQGCIIVRKAFVDENPDAVAAFLAEYAASTTFVNENLDEAAALIEGYGIMGSAAAAKKAIPNANIVCITGQEMKDSAAAMFQVLFEANPASIGGEIPNDGLYYMG